MTKYSLLIGLLLVIFTVGIFGGHFGYTVSGVPSGGEISGSVPGLMGVLDWLWESGVFLFNMVLFRVDNMPVFISMVFTVMSLVVIFMVINLVRGSD